MKEIINVKSPTIAIVAFAPELDRPLSHTVCYQVTIDPDKLSPSGEFIRFDHDAQCEIHGWKKVDEIEILEILEVLPAVVGMAEAA